MQADLIASRLPLLETVQKLTSETFEHESGGGDEDESGAVVRSEFIVFGKAA